MSHQSQPPSRSRLHPSEWLLSGTVFLILVTLLVIANVQAYRLSEKSLKTPPPVEVLIEGFVAKPGSRLVPLGTPLMDVVRKARPKRFADLSAIALDTRVTAPLRLEISKLTHFTVYVEGAVQFAGPQSVPVGTRLSDLKKILALTPEADLAFFKGRRFLNPGEILQIPEKHLQKR